jgi:hypothetical protein
VYGGVSGGYTVFLLQTRYALQVDGFNHNFDDLVLGLMDTEMFQEDIGIVSCVSNLGKFTLIYLSSA